MIRSKQSLFEKSRTRFTAIVFAGDLLFVLAAMLVGHAVRFEYFSEFRPTESFPPLIAYWNHFCLGLLLYTLISHNQHLFRWSVMLSRARTLTSVVKVTALWSFSVVGLSLMLGFDPPISRFFMICSAVSFIILLPLWRFAMHAVLHESGLFENCYRHLVVVGTGSEAQQFAGRVKEGRCDLHRFQGFISTGADSLEEDQLGRLDQLEALMKEGTFDSLAVANTCLPSAEVVRIAKLCEQNFVEFKAIPSSFEVFSSCLQIHNMGGMPVMSLAELPQNRALNRLIKRAVDIVGASIGLMLSLPVFAILIPLIKRESPGPVIYRQVRVGQGGREFKVLKLRSMKLDAEASGKVGWSTQDDPRRLQIGSFMRKWNLDEVPQFWNVLKGEMSLVGPRPERPELITDFIKEIPYYQSRHSVKPGMTGWAQVNGLRGDTSIAERIRHDLQYIENWNVWMDLTIKFKTFFNYKGAC
ncbi:sugar transferase [Pelagicoccus sp. SDUM812002]|uniref:sugar transferase n=1 Tax=Pelagicoccus sp. SDUM812002 TaxID=3041266 RepID=UPI002810A031|nr:sugar transferase [Pelagicoccus sp. SDUM812002]